MHIGIATFATDYSLDIAVLAQRAEELGFESLWVGEHPVLPVHTNTKWPDEPHGRIPKVDGDICDPFVTLARASAVTTRLKLGTGVCLLPERNPLLLAKQVATLDMYSRGRFLFGVGAGWLREETEIMGGDFDHRWGQTRDSVLAMKELWTKTRSEYHGKYYDFPPVHSFPRPAQKPHPPIFLGGNAPGVLSRVVEYGDGWMPYQLVSPEQLKQARFTLNKLVDAAGRDPASIQVSYFCPPDYLDRLDQLKRSGADRVIFQLSTEMEASDPKVMPLAELESARLDAAAKVALKWLCTKTKGRCWKP